MSKNSNGYEYEYIGDCRHGKKVFAPIAWSSKKAPRPHWVDCEICRRRR